ncbi:DUF5895 domain-containing protein [Leptolyngbya sp. AN03gr2]|uniref:DUF5895 domain-containing protein n=1 Tax=unclassified Leptolyngbya TaxID=2650499 RepID=UPI003D31513A
MTFDNNGRLLKTSPTLERPGQELAQEAADEFDAPEFEGEHETLPYMQMLNHQSSEQSGFFLTQENAEAVSFADPAGEWLSHTTSFASGTIVEGYRSLTARFLILRKSPLLMFDREEENFISVFNSQCYNRDTMLLKTRYLVYLVNKQKQPLHQTPLMFTTKATFCGSFGDSYRNFRREMNQAYTQATGAKKARGERFFALSVFAVQVQPELKGKKLKSWVCSIAQYGQPTVQNWKNFFVGYNTELKDKLLSEFEQWEGFGQIQDQSVERSPESQAAETVPSSEYDIDEDFPYMQEF